jgi:hypothetical protein
MTQMIKNYFLNSCISLVLAFSCTSCTRIYDAITLKALVNKPQIPFENPVIITVKNNLPCFYLPPAKPKEYIGIDGTDAKIDYVNISVAYAKKNPNDARAKLVWSVGYYSPKTQRPKAIDMQPLSNIEKCIIYGQESNELKIEPQPIYDKNYTEPPEFASIEYLSALQLNATYIVTIVRGLRDEKGIWNYKNDSPFCVGLDSNKQRVLNPPNCDQPLQ